MDTLNRSIKNNEKISILQFKIIHEIRDVRKGRNKILKRKL